MNSIKGHLNMLRAIFLIAILGFVTTTPAEPLADADRFSYQWWRLAFETPIEFSEPIRLGLGAVSLVHPPEQGLGQGALEITLVAVPKDLADSMDGNAEDILTFVKSTFLGTDQPAEQHSERLILGELARGGRQQTSIPKAGEMEFFLVNLSAGDKAALVVTRDAQTPADDAQSVMDSLARTLQEVEEDLQEVEKE